MTELLLERGADATLRARDGTTALHMAAFAGDAKLAGRLLEKGVDCNARAVGGLTALHVAAFMGYHAIVKLLLARGAVASNESQWRVGECTYDGFDTSGGILPFGLLCNQFRHLVNQDDEDSEEEVEEVVIEEEEEEVEEVVIEEEEEEMADQRSLSAQDLAALGGSTTVLRLLVKQARKKNRQI